MRGNSLNLVLQALKDLGGYFTLVDDGGQEYVIVAKHNINLLRQTAPEVQLALPPVEAPTPKITSADDLLERINRDIAWFQEQQEDPFVEIVLEQEREMDNEKQDETQTVPPPRRVRFEPLRGDLPPELQE